MIMMIRARSLDAVNRSWTLVAALTLMQFTKVSNAERKPYERTLRSFIKSSTFMLYF
ncbi:hypothetical protein UPYG_G00010820 [Umbra pygmaea]|uniref:Uncharacterized protein n=1 Tax=Umbra pygmaea TaxID=75934 RepID=A0ABD0XL85_UMBPY